MAKKKKAARKEPIRYAKAGRSTSKLNVDVKVGILQGIFLVPLWHIGNPIRFTFIQ